MCTAFISQFIHSQTLTLHFRYILWELAIAFSPQRSETAERRLGLDTDVQFAAAGGRVYTEVLVLTVNVQNCSLWVR